MVKAALSDNSVSTILTGHNAIPEVSGGLSLNCKCNMFNESYSLNSLITVMYRSTFSNISWNDLQTLLI